MGGRDKEERKHAVTSVTVQSGASSDACTIQVCLSQVHQQASAFASAGEESPARHGAPPGGSASLSLPQMWADLSGVSPWRDACAEFGAGQRAGRDVIPLGTLLWSGLTGLRELRRAALQDARLRDRTGGSRTRARPQARGSL